MLRIIELSATEALGQDADEALAQLLRQAAELPVRPPADGGRELLMERLGETATEAVVVALLLGWISPDDTAVRSLLAAPGVLRTNAARAGMTALCRLAGQRPVLVLLDDAHWADDALLDALEQATVSELPLWICAFARPAFATQPSGLGTAGRRRSHAPAGPTRPRQRWRALSPLARSGHERA